MKLGLYTVLGEIGRGGMGVVYRAQDPAGRDVAVKVLQARREALARFSREARLQDQLGETDGFVPLLDMGVSPHGPYLVMPLLDSGTLRDKLEGRGPFPIPDAVELVRSLAAGLGKAHARGIVHRDVKPDNVLFSARGLPLLADLGLAKHFRHDVEGASQSFALSRPGQARGTFGYMAPEQLRDAAKSGPPADVYALGAVLYEVVTGHPAFKAATFVELMSKVAEGKVAHPRSLRRDCPAWLSAVIAKSLAVDPAKRYADGVAFAAALEAGPHGASGRRRPMLAAVVMTLLAVGLAAWTYSVRGTSPPPSGPPVEPVVPPPPAWTLLPTEYQALARVEQGPRLVAVWGHDRDVGAVLALAEHEDGAMGLEARGLRRWGGPIPGGLLIATPPPEQRFHTGALRPDLGRGLTSSDSLLGWNLDDASPVVEIPLEKPSRAVSLGPSGLRGVLALGSTLFRFRLGLGLTAEPTALPVQHPDSITAVAAGAGQQFLSASDSLVVFHHPRGSQEIQQAEVVGLGFLEPDQRPLTLDVHGALHTLQDDSLQVLVEAPEAGDLGPAIALALDAKGTRVAIGHLNGVRLLEDRGSGWREQQRVLLPTEGARLTSLALGRRQGTLLVGTSRGAILKFALEAAADDDEHPLPTWLPLGSAGSRRGRLADSPEGLWGLPDGRLLSVSGDGWVCTWDADGNPLSAFNAGTLVLGAQLRGTDQLITQGGGRCLRVWDLNYDPPAESQRIGLEGMPVHLALSPDGRYAAVGDLNGRVTYLDLDQRKRIAAFDAGRGLGALACLPDGRVALGLPGEVQIVDPVSGARDEPRLTGGGQVTAIAVVSPARFVAGTDQGATLMFNLERKVPEWITMIGGHAVTSLSIGDDHVLVGMRLGTVMRQGLESGGSVWEVDGGVGPQTLVRHLDDGRAVVGGTLRTLRLIDTTTGTPLWPEFEGHLGAADALSFTNDGAGLVSVGTEGARGWSIEDTKVEQSWHVPMVYNLQAAVGRNGAVFSEELLQPLKPRETLQVGLRLHRPPPAKSLTFDLGEFEKIAISPDGKLGFTFASDPDRAAVFDLERDGQMNVIYTLGGRFNACAFSPDGTRVAFALGSELSLREAKRGELEYRVEGRADTLAFLPGADGELRLLCGRNLGGLELRELEGGKVVQRLSDEVEVETVCAVGPDRFLTLGSGVVQAWDLAISEQPIARLDLGDETDQVSGIAADPTTQRLALSTGKGRVVVYRWGG